jgi:hypothetical protein
MQNVLTFYVKAKYMPDFLAKNREKEMLVKKERTIETPNLKCRLY